MKDDKPVGRKKFIASTKKQFLKSCQTYAKQLEDELRAVYNDPNTIVGKFSMAFQNSQTANKRLSVLCASLIKSAGGSVVVHKDQLESFKGMALNIKWEAPDGVKMEDATSYTFSYDAIPEAQLVQQQANPPVATVGLAATPIDPVVASPHPDPVPAKPMPIGPEGWRQEQETENSPNLNIEVAPSPAAETAAAQVTSS